MATLDLISVRGFTDSFNAKVRRCDNGEGMECSNLDQTIAYYVDLCSELRDYIVGWARAVFTTELPLDPEVETLLKGELAALLKRAEQVAVQGRLMNGECFELLQLNQLHWYIADLSYLNENWVSPQSAVAPAPRVKLTEALTKQIPGLLAKLPPLPKNWQPTNAEQRAVFEKHRQE